ncbi:hypothetical protein D9619_010064 [Psilocybe cf. subviscida]|uniref:EF-hand domain-containing protein n=1 Tax=Psilocybe cf. subviscida TaxID=2480587 RepID=A0A8H5BLS4_9AGAR|nr:hypothetical protein D9619_010064 [Psilocybe cf. subviscida]
MADTILPPTNLNAANQNTHDEIWGRFKKFYSKNEKTLEKCINTDVEAIAKGEKVSDIEQQIDSFSETTKIVLDGLAELGKIHPIIGAAVVAFHAVISLDLTRRENDRKVIVIMVEMQNMMCAMFQLRHLNHTHVDGNERDEEKSNLDRLVKSVTDDITKCGGDIDYYFSQKFVLKMAKAWNFEARFKKHVETFAKRRSELQFAITAYAAVGVDHANITLAVVSTKIDAIFSVLFRKLDTSLERETQEFLNANGGIKNCVAKDDLLVRLVALAGDAVPESEGGDKREDKVAKSRLVLQEELQKDFTESLKQNTLHFESLLRVQDNNHEDIMTRFEKQEGYEKDIISKLNQMISHMHPETRLNDPDLRRIWDDMGLKTSVKAKTFILTFRDHYQQQKHAPLSAYPVPATNQTAETSKEAGQSLTVATNFGDSGSADVDNPNAWLLEYIDIAHVRPIVEAIDADSSGFISVKEINVFARSKPTAWSFLQWMVYWAAGWHINILAYRDKIYDILIQMHELLPLIHPGNQRHVDRFLDSYSMRNVEAMLRSTKDVGVDRQSSQLKELASFYADSQEAALKTNLREMSYKISSPTDANLVAGAARWIYPVLYLLLDRHLAILKLAKSCILHENEMITHEISLYNIFTLFFQRRDMLQAIFSQIHLNVAGRFEAFAYGMFYASYKRDAEISPVKSTLTKARAKATRQNIILASRTKKEAEDARPDLSILALGKVPSFDFELLNVHPPSDAVGGPLSNPLGGYWCGVCWDTDGDVFPDVGLLHYTLNVESDGRVSGTGECYRGAVELSGHVSQGPTDDSLYDVTLKMPYRADLLIFFAGVYDAERDAMYGNWESGYDQPIPGATDAGTSAGNIQEDTEAVDGKEALPEQSEHTDSVHYQDIDPGDSSDESDPEPYTDSSHPPTNVNDAASEARKDGDTLNEPEGDGHTQSPGASRSPVRRNSPPEEVDSDESEKEEQIEGTYEYEEGVVESVIAASGRFSFTRTSAEVFKYRAHLTSEENASLSDGRKRWNFATEAIRYQVRAKRFSWNHVRRKFAERKLWVTLSLKYLRSILAMGESDTLWRIVGGYHPAEGRLYDILSEFLDQRLYSYIVARNEYCDYCKDDIAVSRFRCITCMKEDLSNQVDLCVDKPACIASPTTNMDYNFVHIPSHTLLRSNYFIHDCDLAALIALCRTRSDDIKRKYRLLEEGKKATKRKARSSKIGKAIEASQKDESSAAEPMTCVCCQGHVSLPCWICATCALHTAICLDCERTGAAVKLNEGGTNSRPHSHEHLLLRIHDNKEIHPREVNNARLQQELSNVTADLRSLKEEVESHLKSARKVNDVLQALAESNPNFKPLVLEAADIHGYSDALSEAEVSISDIFTNMDGPLSAPMSPNVVIPSPLPVASEPSAEPTVTAGESAASSTSANHLENKPLINAIDTSGDIIEESTIVVVNADQPAPSILPENAPAVKDVSTRVKPQFLDASPPALANPPPSSASVAADHLPTDHLSILPRNQGTSARMKSKVLDARLDALDKRMSDMEKAVDGRFSGLENQIGEILALLKQGSQS